MKTVKLVMIIGVISLALLAFTKVEQDKWVVPAKYKTMKNPIASRQSIELKN